MILYNCLLFVFVYCLYVFPSFLRTFSFGDLLKATSDDGEDFCCFIFRFSLIFLFTGRREKLRGWPTGEALGCVFRAMLSGLCFREPVKKTMYCRVLHFTL